MTTHHYIQPRGFIALMSAIIISIILLLIIAQASFSSFFTRFNLADTEYKERSLALADACVDTLMLRLAYDATYSGLETISVGSDSCTIKAALSLGSVRTYPIQAQYPSSGQDPAYTNLLVTVDVNAQTVTSWQEVDMLP